MNAPRISVIVPVYNADSTIEATLASLLGQTCRDLEIVVVDDGSTDDTSDIVKHIAAHAELPVRVFHQPNGGRADARNRGMAEARGEFLGFVDADDTAEPTMFERLLACAGTTGADMVVCEYLGVDADTGDVRFRYREGESALYGGSVLEHPGLLSSIAGSVCNKLISRRLFEDGGIDFPAHRDFEDLATVYRLMGEAHHIDKVAEPLYRYRQGHPASIMNACDERFLQILDALALTNDHFKDRGDFDALRTDLETINYTHLITGRMVDLLRYGSRSVRHDFIGRAFAHMDRYFPGWRHDPPVRAASGRLAKWVVGTNMPLLTFYTDLRSEALR